MSRIATVQKSLESVCQHLNDLNTDVSVVFFNHEYKIFTTLKATDDTVLSGNLSIKDIISKINNINCFGSTEFTQIKTAIQKIKKLSKPEEWENTVSFITSDGQQTALSTMEVEDDLSNFFDYSVGIGNHETDFDKEFLERISKNFVFGKNPELINKTIHNVLNNIREPLNKEHEIHMYVQPNIKFSTLCEHVLINIDTDIMDDSIHDAKDNIEDIIDFRLVKDNDSTIFTFKDNFNLNKKEEYAHLIFVIDISSSMDEPFNLYNEFNSNEEIYIDYDDSQIEIKNTTNFMWKRITFKNFINNYLYCSLEPKPEYIFIEYNLVLYKVKLDNYIIDTKLEKVFNFFNKISMVLDTFSNEVSRNKKITILDNLFTNIKNDTCVLDMIDNIDRNYPLYNHVIESITKQINILYFTFLTTKESTFFNLLHEKNDHNYDNSIVITDTVINKKDQHYCIICYKNVRNILLSCGHVVTCQSCTIYMINYNTLNCPICRKETSFIKKLSPYTETLKCLSKNCNNQISILYEPCYHIYYCNNCFYKAEENYCICGVKTNGIYSIQFS